MNKKFKIHYCLYEFPYMANLVNQDMKQRVVIQAIQTLKKEEVVIKPKDLNFMCNKVSIQNRFN